MSTRYEGQHRPPNSEEIEKRDSEAFMHGSQAYLVQGGVQR